LHYYLQEKPIAIKRNVNLILDPLALHPIGPLQAGLMALQQKLQEAMRNQTSLVEENVRHYSEQQYADLEAFRKTAHEDQIALARILQVCPALQKEEEALAAAKPPQKPARENRSTVKLDNVMITTQPLPYLKPAALSKGGNLPAKPRKSLPSMVKRVLSFNMTIKSKIFLRIEMSYFGA